MSSNYDVVVVGGGPAGSLAAYHLAKAGVRTLVLDAQSFPRDKTCGGGLQQRAALQIPFDWTSTKRSDLDQVCFSYNCGPRFVKKSHAPLVYGILRREFDALLLDHARSAGARVLENCRVRGVEHGGAEFTTIETSSGAMAARFIIGADGANSVVRQSMNRRSDYHWAAAISCEVPEDCLRPLACSTARIDWGRLPSGYGWIFPKRGFANIGVGGPPAVGKMLRPYLMHLLETDGILKRGALERLRFRGHQLPTLLPGTPLSKGNVLLVGDAAGLVDPLTGDGLSCALHSAGIVSRTVLELLRGEHEDPAIYDRRILDEIGGELFWSRKMLSFLTAFPYVLYRAIGGYDRIWRAYCRVMRGEDSLLIFQKKFDAVGPLLRMVEKVAERRERGLLSMRGQTEGPVLRT